MPLHLLTRSRPVTILASLILCLLLFSLYIFYSHDGGGGSITSSWGGQTWRTLGQGSHRGSQHGTGQDASPTRIPRKMWYKLGPSGLSADTRKWTNSCIDLNPEFEVEFLTDSSADRWVQHTFGDTHPDLVEVFLGLTVPIVKADLLRYLLLWAEGGVYNDLDVSCDVPIREWIPAALLPGAANDTSIIAGWEFDYGWSPGIKRQLATWTIASVARSPHMWAVVEDILAHLHSVMRENNLPVGELTRDTIGNIITATGPKRFTGSLMRSLGEQYGVKQAEVENLLEPKMLGDLLVLPGFSFAKSSNRYGDLKVPPSLVKHHYAGSWKNPEGGESTTSGH